MARKGGDMFERQIGVDSMTRTEREVMQLLDAGAGIENTREITGLTVARIRHIHGYLSVTGLETWKDDARHGSAALIAALRRHHPERCGAAS